MLDMKLASPRWAAIAIMDDHTLILFDMHQAMDLKGCGVCEDCRVEPEIRFPRWNVVQFLGSVLCAQCGGPSDNTVEHTIHYSGDDETTARGMFAAEEARMHNAVLGGQ